MGGKPGSEIGRVIPVFLVMQRARILRLRKVRYLVGAIAGGLQLGVYELKQLALAGLAQLEQPSLLSSAMKGVPS